MLKNKKEDSISRCKCTVVSLHSVLLVLFHNSLLYFAVCFTCFEEEKKKKNTWHNLGNDCMIE